MQFLLSRPASGDGWHYGFGQPITLRAEHGSAVSSVSLGLKIHQSTMDLDRRPAQRKRAARLRHIRHGEFPVRVAAVVNDSVFR